MWSKTFWKDAAERAIATFFQSGLAIVSLGAISAAVSSADWTGAWMIVSAGLLAGGVAAVFSLAKSLVAAYTGEKGTAQLGVATYKES